MTLPLRRLLNTVIISYFLRKRPGTPKKKRLLDRINSLKATGRMKAEWLEKNNLATSRHGFIGNMKGILEQITTTYQ
ncbi:MAG TPA: hypothetical protein DCO77_04120 [Nitrospiraceae bacterium]|nr:hypothetical protein [Nitrospiraceae bacterium]